MVKGFIFTTFLSAWLACDSSVDPFLRVLGGLALAVLLVVGVAYLLNRPS